MCEIEKTCEISKEVVSQKANAEEGLSSLSIDTFSIDSQFAKGLKWKLQTEVVKSSATGLQKR